VSYDSVTNTATLSPLNLLADSTSYTATVLGGAGGAADTAGNPLAADYSWSFSTAAAGSSAAISLWDDTYSPSVLEDPDQTARTQGVELGVKFRSATGGYITGLRFYKGPNNDGPHTGSLWTAGGTLLASVTFTNETASGWQEMSLPSPVAIAAETTYVVSYHAPFGRYSASPGYFSGSGFENYPLRALADGEQGGNGLYRYGSGAFPNQTWNSEHYWVDVVFQESL
jgi:hypothetical protein